MHYAQHARHEVSWKQSSTGQTISQEDESVSATDASRALSLIHDDIAVKAGYCVHYQQRR